MDRCEGCVDKKKQGMSCRYRNRSDACRVLRFCVSGISVYRTCVSRTCAAKGASFTRYRTGR